MNRFSDAASEGQEGAGQPAPCRVESIERNAAGLLVVKLEDGREVEGARVARCFPWSLPERFISLLDADGHEVALLDHLDVLDEPSRSVVIEELADKIFNPKIQEILRFKDDFGVVSITARTDRGEVTFQVRSRDDVRVLSPVRALFRDADGNTYELEDYRRLEPRIRRELQRYF